MTPPLDGPSRLAAPTRTGGTKARRFNLLGDIRQGTCFFDCCAVSVLSRGYLAVSVLPKGFHRAHFHDLARRSMSINCRGGRGQSNAFALDGSSWFVLLAEKVLVRASSSSFQILGCQAGQETTRSEAKPAQLFTAAALMAFGFVLLGWSGFLTAVVGFVAGLAAPVDGGGFFAAGRTGWVFAAAFLAAVGGWVLDVGIDLAGDCFETSLAVAGAVLGGVGEFVVFDAAVVVWTVACCAMPVLGGLICFGSGAGLCTGAVFGFGAGLATAFGGAAAFGVDLVDSTVFCAVAGFGAEVVDLSVATLLTWAELCNLAKFCGVNKLLVP